MSWRPGELWLDADDLWARAPTLPAVASESVALPLGFWSPPGLIASRARRAAWEGRRRARRMRTAALVATPTLLVAVAGVRGAHKTVEQLLAEDLPSATSPPLGPKVTTTVRERKDVAVSRESPLRSLAHFARPAVEAPTIAWHHATSVGSPSDGRLVDGTQLPLVGPDWLTWNPVTDGAPNRPDRLYGHERVIRAIVSVAGAYRAAHPEAPPVLVGDISRKGGGPMADEHVSHENGLDVDVYLPRRDRVLRAPTEPGQVDRRLAQELLERFLRSGAQVVFVGFSSGLRGPSGRVVPIAGHEYHMHVRFPAPA